MKEDNTKMIKYYLRGCQGSFYLPENEEDYSVQLCRLLFDGEEYLILAGFKNTEFQGFEFLIQERNQCDEI